MIEARGISKTYGTHHVLEQASLTVTAGQCVVLSGDNGSGKTTLLHVMMGLRRPTAGRVMWHGEALSGAGAWRRARKRWGFLPQQGHLPPTASVGQLLRFHARLRETSLDVARQWLERVGLEESENQQVAELSGGMQQRLGIALTLFPEPALIVMDEPASSLDPGWRDALRQWLVEQAHRGTGVLVTSQLHEPWPNNVTHLHCEAGRIMDQTMSEGAGA